MIEMVLTGNRQSNVINHFFFFFFYTYALFYFPYITQISDSSLGTTINENKFTSITCNFLPCWFAERKYYVVDISEVITE